jgi:hypothetical protein
MSYTEHELPRSVETFAKDREVLSVAPCHLLVFTGLKQSLERVRAGRFQQPITRFDRTELHDDERLVNERAKGGDDRRFVDGFVATDGAGGLETPPSDENPETLEHALLPRRKQRVAPVEGGPKGLMARKRRSLPGTQECKAVVQSLRDDLETKAADPRRGEFDR